MTAEWILTSTVLMLAVILVRAVLGRRMGPKLRYGLWLLVLARLLLPFSFGQSAASPANLVRVQEQTAFVVPMVTAPPADAGVSVEPDGTILDSNAMGHAVVNEPDGTVTRYASTFDLKGVLLDLLPKIWIVGMAAAAVWFLFCNLLFYRNLRRSRRLLQRDGKLPIYEADAPSPCLFGLFRPAVYVTPDAADDEWMLEHTLLHEKTHLRHGDHIWAFLRTVCLILWWYHPLVWIAARLSRQDGELYCDAAVIETLGEEHRAEYGRTLLALSTKRRPASAFCAASTLSRGGRQLKSRITAIARWAKPKRWAIVLALLIAAIAVGCAFTGATQAPAGTETDAVDTTQVVTATTPEPDPARTPGPLTDADLMGGDPIHLGMSFEQADAVLSFTETELLGTAADMQTYLRGSTLYTFTQDSEGRQFWLTSITTDTDANFLSLGIGVGSTLDEVVTLLGCDPADDPGADQPWQLYGTEGEINSAQVAPGETDGIRFLSIWTESGGCQFQLQQNVVIQTSAYLSGPVEQRAVTDADLSTIHAIELGTPYDEVLNLLGPSATVTEQPNSTLVEQDGLIFLFRDLGDGMQLLSYSSNAVGTELPLGLTVGGSIDGFLRDELGVTELPELPLSEPLFLYGSEETSMSALLDISYADSPGELEIYTEHFLFRCRLNEDRTILYADCSDRKEPSSLLRFKTTPKFQECTALDGVDFHQYSGYSGAVVYTQDGGAPQVAYCVQGYRPHFTVADPSGVGTDLEYQPGSLRQVSGEQIALSLKDPATGQTTEWQVIPQWAADGTVTFASGPVSDSPAAQQEDPASNDSAPAEAPTPTTREEFLARLAADDYLRKTEVLGCVMFDGPSSKVDGVALCRRPDTGTLWVVYSTPDIERKLFPMGIGNYGELDYVDGSFSYADQAAHLTVYNRVIGQNLDYAISYRVESSGAISCSTETTPLLLDRYASFRSGKVLDWMELPGSAEADGVLVISADGSEAYPQVCYCYGIYELEPRFVYSDPADGLQYQSGSLRHVSGDEITLTLKNPETGAEVQWTATPSDSGDSVTVSSAS